MKPCERIKYLRKQLLKLNQLEFSRRINLSRSNLGNIEIGNINPTDRVIADICREFHIRREWIMDGEEPVFQNSVDPLDERISQLYAQLSLENKKYLYGYIQRLVEEQE